MRQTGIVADGWYRAVSAAEPVIRAEVQAEFAERFKVANEVEHKRLRAEMERTIRLRERVKASQWSLY